MGKYHIKYHGYMCYCVLRARIYFTSNIENTHFHRNYPIYVNTISLHIHAIALYIVYWSSWNCFQSRTFLIHVCVNRIWIREYRYRNRYAASNIPPHYCGKYESRPKRSDFFVKIITNGSRQASSFQDGRFNPREIIVAVETHVEVA